MRKFVIMIDTVVEGAVIGLHEDEKPVFFDTAIDAWKDIAQDKIEELEQFIKGDRELDHTNFNFEEWVEEVEVDADGQIIDWIELKK